MPDEPNQKMDELLRTYAEERRKSAGDMTVHPVTRQMLQREVSQVFGPGRAPAPWYHRLRGFWPQIAFAGSMCLVLGIAVLSLRQPSRPDVKSRMDEPARTLEPSSRDATAAAVELKVEQQNETDRPPPAVEPGASKPQGDEMFRVGQREESAQRERFLSESAPAVEQTLPLRGPQTQSIKEEREQVQTPLLDAPPAEIAAPALTKRSAGLPAVPSGPTASASPQAVAPPAPTVQQRVSSRPSAAVAGTEDSGLVGLSNLGAARRLNFVQAANADERANVSKAAATPVLSTFEVEQTGEALMFYDQDGSIYRGTMKPVEANAALSTVKLDSNSARELLQNPAVYNFNVQGSNRTLGSELVLTGQFLSETNVQPSTLDTFAIAPDAKAKQQAPVRHVIIGNATIGITNQMPVRAISR